MTEITFRAKSHNAPVDWVTGQYYKDPQGKSTILTRSKCIVVDSNTVQQFTGFKDKFGVPIYEGDILKMHDRLAIVTWHPKAGCWDSQFKEQIGDKLDPNFAKQELGRTCFWCNYEIVGNIIDGMKTDFKGQDVNEIVDILLKVEKELSSANWYLQNAVSRGVVGETVNCRAHANQLKDRISAAENLLSKIL